MTERSDDLQDLSPTRYHQLQAWHTATSEYPLTGLGTAGFYTRFTSLAPAAWKPLEVHNTYLGVWAEIGVPGLIALTLLYLGIGDTIRVSLTAHPREEVIAAYEILKSLNLRQHGPILVSCPTCGRTEVDIIGLAEAVEKELMKITKPIKVAVMGCVVNGPGEARDADIGIACGQGKAVLFKKGEKVGVVEEKDFFTAIMAEVQKLAQ